MTNNPCKRCGYFDATVEELDKLREQQFNPIRIKSRPCQCGKQEHSDQELRANADTICRLKIGNKKDKRYKTEVLRWVPHYRDDTKDNEPK